MQAIATNELFVTDVQPLLRCTFLSDIFEAIYVGAQTAPVPHTCVAVLLARADAATRRGLRS